MLRYYLVDDCLAEADQGAKEEWAQVGGNEESWVGGGRL